MLLQRYSQKGDTKRKVMKIKEIVRLVNGKLLTSEYNKNKEIKCAFAADLISDILMCTKEPTLLLTGLTNPQIIRLADMIDLEGIVFVRGKKPPKEIIDMAKERELPLIITPFTMFKTSGILFQNGIRSCSISEC